MTCYRGRHLFQSSQQSSQQSIYNREAVFIKLGTNFNVQVKHFGLSFSKETILTRCETIFVILGISVPRWLICCLHLHTWEFIVAVKLQLTWCQVLARSNHIILPKDTATVDGHTIEDHIVGFCCHCSWTCHINGEVKG